MLVYNPTYWEDRRSANVQVSRAGGTATPAASATGSPGPYRGVWWTSAMVQGSPQDFSGREPDDVFAVYYSSEASSSPPGAEQVLQVIYDRPVEASTIRFIEGDHFDGTGGLPEGGWFTTITAEVQGGGGGWAAPAGTWSAPLDPSRPFQIIDLALDVPQMVTGVRVRGLAGGSGAFVPCTTLDVLSSPPGANQIPRGSFDVDGRAGTGIDDLCAWTASPIDLDGDGAVSGRDARYLEAALRF